MAGNEDAAATSTAQERTQGDGGERKGKQPFGGLSPSEAGKRSAESRRRKAAERAEDAAEQDPKAIARTALEKKAKTGDVQAARELREHHDYYYGGSGTEVWELLTREQRAIVRGWIEALPD